MHTAQNGGEEDKQKHKRYIKVEGNTAEQKQSHLGAVAVDQKLEMLRSYLVGFFFRFHEEDDEYRHTCADDNDIDHPYEDDEADSFAYTCAKCKETTLYYRKPADNYRPSLCLSTTCLSVNFIED